MYVENVDEENIFGVFFYSFFIPPSLRVVETKPFRHENTLVFVI